MRSVRDEWAGLTADGDGSDRPDDDRGGRNGGGQTWD